MDISDHVYVRMVLYFFLVGFIDGKKEFIIFPAIQCTGDWIKLEFHRSLKSKLIDGNFVLVNAETYFRFF